MAFIRFRLHSGPHGPIGWACCAVALFLIFPLAAISQTAKLTGNWTGSVGTLALIAHLDEPATLDIPAQNVRALPIEFFSKADSVYLRLPAAGVLMAARCSADGDELVGQWRQKGQVLPFTLRRAVPGSPSNPARPQTPQPPFPYQSEEVSFQNKVAGVTLAGTFTVPTGLGPFPAVVLLTGSGPEDRNESVFGHQPFWILADYLTRRGVAVLRFDDRGVGQSGGMKEDLSSVEYASDALAALAFVRARSRIDRARVGLLGHSEGGTAAIGAAGQPHGPDFLVLLATPGLPGDELIVQQVVTLGHKANAALEQVTSAARLQRQIVELIQQTPDNAQARTKLRVLLNPTASANPQALLQVDKTIDQLLSSAYRSLLADRPSQTLARVRCPVLALNGSKDVQVAAQPNLSALANGLLVGGNHRVTTRELLGLNHLFQSAVTGLPSEYGTIEETFSPTALQIIGDWLAVGTKR